MTFLEALLMKWSEKQPSCTGLRREWETTLEAGSGDCFLKKQEIGDIDKNCRMGWGWGMEWVVRVLFYLGWETAFISC